MCVTEFVTLYFIVTYCDMLCMRRIKYEIFRAKTVYFLEMDFFDVMKPLPELLNVADAQTYIRAEFKLDGIANLVANPC